MRLTSNLKYNISLWILLIVVLTNTKCKHDPELNPLPNPEPTDCDTMNVTYYGTVFPIIQENCLWCHSGQTPSGNLDYNQVAFVAQSGVLLSAINHESGYVPMPKDGNKLDDCSINKIKIWINDTTFTDPGGGNDDSCDPDTIYFTKDVLPLIISNCTTTDCHDKLTDEQDVILLDYASIIQYGDIEPGDPGESKLYKKITEDDPDKRMPPPPEDPLTTEQKEVIKKWIEQGAINNSCSEECDTSNVTFSGTIWPIIELNCNGCHSGSQPSGGFELIDYTTIMVQINNGKLFGAINHLPNFQPMPRNAPKLSDCKIDQIQIWIENGTPNN